MRDLTAWTLNLEYCPLGSLPEGFGELKHLQTLNLGGCWELISLPERFGKLENLENLDLGYCVSLRSLSEGFGELQKLEKLDSSPAQPSAHCPNGSES